MGYAVVAVLLLGCLVIGAAAWPPLRRVPGLVKTWREIRGLEEHSGSALIEEDITHDW